MATLRFRFRVRHRVRLLTINSCKIMPLPLLLEKTMKNMNLKKERRNNVHA